ncbi:MAG: hypothetical protein RR376_01490 [Janthinobacterium sp.]
MQLNEKVAMAALFLAACASLPPCATAAAVPRAATAAKAVASAPPEVRKRDLLLLGAGLILLAGRRRPTHDKWQCQLA